MAQCLKRFISKPLAFWVKISADDISIFFFFKFFFQKIGFDISYKLSPMETTHEMSNLFFWEKKKKNIIILLSAEIVEKVVKVYEAKCKMLWGLMVLVHMMSSS